MEDITLDTGMSSGDANLTESMRANLREAFKWMKIVSIIQMVFIGLGALGGLLALMNNPAVGIVALGIYGLMFYVALLLFQSGQSFTNFESTGSASNLEDCFAKQKQFWTIAGILLIVTIVLYIIFFIVLFNSGPFYRF